MIAKLVIAIRWSLSTHLLFCIWGEVRAQAIESKLGGIPKLVTEMTISLHAKNIKINVSTCSLKIVN